ncbi:DUF1566 domain-containing protein [Hydrogenophaga sp. RWCD_12]|uniref:DUF1566 domain-containing protein n=1 Tax=Hydrogenophaga sp. RWCD_12 TaxID=3391190 RepID=UPI003984F291
MSKPRPLFSPFLTRSLVTVVLSAVLTACGGSGSPETAEGRASSAVAGGAVLNSAELAAAEKAAVAADASPSPTPLDELPAGQIAAKSAYVSGAVARKALATRIPVYRFYNGSTGAHFFTTNTTERDNIVATLSPPFSLEGAAFSVASAFSPGLSPVHRFYNTQTGVHFYTISESERANVVATLPHFTYEGVAYHASQVAGQGLIPFYRFFVPSKGFHFYTASEAEKDSIIANLAATYSFEGIGYYVLDTNWQAEKLPHSGVTASKCYQAGSDVLVACSTPEASNLNPLQDGHRAAINRMFYSSVAGQALTSCVRSDVTGLIWEGKTDDGGLRDKDNTYTNLGGGAATDTSGYVAAVNALNLCGFSDWRLPTRQELLGLVDYGKAGVAPINTTYFGNTALVDYWSSDVRSTDNTRAWRVGWAVGGGASSALPRAGTYAVRLVRGDTPSGTRFTFSTIVYGSDAANNVVNDAWTGLQWRRCEEGRVWSGSACTGTESAFNHEQALAHARGESGWRLPNIKELVSLVDLSVRSGSSIDPAAFHSASVSFVWTSSPYVSDPSRALNVSFDAGASFNEGGSVYIDARTFTDAVRLVRASQ